MGEDTVGIAGLGSYLPEQVVDAWEAVASTGISRRKLDKIGCKRLHIAAEGEMPSDMAVAAGRRALADAELDPADIDLIIYTGSVKDHGRWQAAAKVQADLGCSRAFGFDIYQGCNGQIIAMAVARSMMADNPRLHNVLICSAERYASTLDPPIVAHTYLFGDGASAGILRRGHPELALLSSVYKTWGDHHHTFCVPAMGASTRLTPAVLEGEGLQLQIYRPLYESREKLQEFGEQVLTIARQLLEKAARRAGVRLEDVDFVVNVNGSRRHNQIFMDTMGFGGRRSAIDYIEETAHMGSPDVYYNLDRARREGILRKDDLIVLYTGGGGYTWAITLARY